MNLQLVVAVAIGGAIGSVARYLTAIGAGKVFGPGYPWAGTFIVNIVGSFIIGVLVGGFALRWNLPQSMRAFLVVGFCGGFTTFSTFSLDSIRMIEHGALVSAAAYIVASVVLSVAALFAALHLMRAVA